jgi:hypothetical protein
VDAALIKTINRLQDAFAAVNVSTQSIDLPQVKLAGLPFDIIYDFSLTCWD